ncbi:MAG: MFS transporter [Lachnospiraceae bacterium]|nr:MFS transporter [Lachnospiraceae bacterium]
MNNAKQNGKIIWTAKYAILNAAYFSAFCTVHAYAAVYLLAKGMTNTQVGILLAVSNILSAVLQPVVAGIIDRPGSFTNKRCIIISVTAIMAGSAVLLAFPDAGVVIFIIYALIYTIQFVYQPVLTALCFEYRKKGCDIIFGLARGLGSAGFAVTSLFIGRAVEENGVSVLLWMNIAVMIISLIAVLTFNAPGQGPADDTSVHTEGHSAHNGFAVFAKLYPAFMAFLVGTICFFFGHNMINDFMIVIIRNLGGGETQMGYATFLQAILELPVMAAIGIVLKKYSADKLLVFSGMAFWIKITILVFATNMIGMYVSQSFQLFAYAVFVPAGAYYVSQTMEEFDQVKGQAYITSAITIGGVFSNLISGVILDRLGITTMLLTGSAVCAVGVIVTFIGMKKLPRKNTDLLMEE